MSRPLFIAWLALAIAVPGRGQDLHVRSTAPGEVILEGDWSGDVFRGTCDDAALLAAAADPPLVDRPPNGSFYYDAGANIGFRVQRTVERGGGLFGQTFTCVPARAGLRDIAGPDSNGCTTGPDGVLTADDLLCELLLDGFEGTAQLMRLDRDDCSLEVRTGSSGAIGILLSGTSFALAADEGHVLHLSSGRTSSHVLELAGSHDPTWPGAWLDGNCDLLVPVPFHSLHRTADEILCGRRGVDWVDGDGDGQPDSCPGGVFDPLSGALVTVLHLRGDRLAGTSTEARSVFAAGGDLFFVGADFALEPGEAVALNWDRAHPPTLFRPPTAPSGAVSLVGCP